MPHPDPTELRVAPEAYAEYLDLKLELYNEGYPESQAALIAAREHLGFPEGAALGEYEIVVEYGRG